MADPLPVDPDPDYYVTLDREDALAEHLDRGEISADELTDVLNDTQDDDDDTGRVRGIWSWRDRILTAMADTGGQWVRFDELLLTLTGRRLTDLDRRSIAIRQAVARMTWPEQYPDLHHRDLNTEKLLDVQLGQRVIFYAVRLAGGDR